MLDDDTGRFVEGFYAFPGGIGIGDVVVGELLAAMLCVIGNGTRSRCAVTVERSFL